MKNTLFFEFCKYPFIKDSQRKSTSIQWNAEKWSQNSKFKVWKFENFKKYFKVDDDNVFVIYDDIDLSLGKLKIKFGGSHAGHNGVKSICQHLQTADFYKIRIGVGRPEQKEKIANYVLSKFFKFELDIVEETIDKISNDLEKIISSNSTNC